MIVIMTTTVSTLSLSWIKFLFLFPFWHLPLFKLNNFWLKILNFVFLSLCLSVSLSHLPLLQATKSCEVTKQSSPSSATVNLLSHIDFSVCILIFPTILCIIIASNFLIIKINDYTSVDFFMTVVECIVWYDAVEFTI
jgi:hypothetical protein